ncbi:hypothetical protein VXS06_14780 [Photobacterium toruni]|uniref:Uncharacterized protein n=1 Tax=Photobacterium toruni TaxID=1935446 RepID=A0ABU6L9F3_9GAMM|nr:hypothetical protein [Photobacterium toruni]
MFRIKKSCLGDAYVVQKRCGLHYAPVYAGGAVVSAPTRSEAAQLLQGIIHNAR